MQKTLDKLTIKLCENLPLDWTFYEMEGVCKKPSEDCSYCKENKEDIYFCNKKTYILNSSLTFIF